MHEYHFRKPPQAEEATKAFWLLTTPGRSHLKSPGMIYRIVSDCLRSSEPWTPIDGYTSRAYTLLATLDIAGTMTRTYLKICENTATELGVWAVQGHFND